MHSVINRVTRESEMKNYIEEGRKSFHKNKGRYTNPYRLGSNQYNDYERGWTQALKQAPDELFSRYDTQRVADEKR
jgi:hypothetical protein